MDNWSIIEPILFLASFLVVIYFFGKIAIEATSGNSPWRKKKWELSRLKDNKDSDFEKIVANIPILEKYFN